MENARSQDRFYISPQKSILNEIREKKRIISFHNGKISDAEYQIQQNLAKIQILEEKLKIIEEHVGI